MSLVDQCPQLTLTIAAVMLRAQAEASGATLLIATHDARLKTHFGHRLELPARA